MDATIRLADLNECRSSAGEERAVADWAVVGTAHTPHP